MQFQWLENAVLRNWIGGTNFWGLRLVPLAPYGFSPAGENR